MSKELKIGVVSIIAIVCFIWGFNFMKGQNIFDPDIRFFKVEYQRIGDLTKSSAVTIHGLRVGKVEDIEFNEDPAKRGQLVVRFSVEKDFPFSKNSVVRIYSPSPLGGSNLAIIPDYTGEDAVSGDTLPGEMEAGLFTTIGERLDPLQSKLESVMIKADTLFSSINHVLNKKAVDNVNTSVEDLSIILKELKSSVIGVNRMITDNEESLATSLENTKKITSNISQITDSLSTVNIAKMIKTAETTLENFNELSKKINSKEGTVGKLINDEEMYNNLTAASKELELLLKDLKENPKRYVHFSIFGKKQKPYKPEEK
jgi:phospholipid/cholesterol/gamma-HCH transport system substrate-binding protein